MLSSLLIKKSVRPISQPTASLEARTAGLASTRSGPQNLPSTTPSRRLVAPTEAARTEGRESYNRPVTFDDYKVVLYRQEDGSWVAEIPALGGCYALMDTREAALAELEQVFALIAQEHQDRGVALPKDTTEIVHA
jgi:predicted RNase H-like HicB family nuclease